MLNLNKNFTLKKPKVKIAFVEIVEILKVMKENVPIVGKQFIINEKVIIKKHQNVIQNVIVVL